MTLDILVVQYKLGWDYIMPESLIIWWLTLFVAQLQKNPRKNKNY